MRKIVLAVSAAALFGLCASQALADGIFLDFDSPDVFELDVAPNPYFGTTWSNISGDGSDLGLMDYDFYNATYGAFLDPISGEQVGWSRFGWDNIGVDFGGVHFAKSIYLTPWKGFGPASMQLDFYRDGGLVGSIFNIAMVEDRWTFVDLEGIRADSMVFRNFGDAQWYLMENLSLNKIPEPSSFVALLSIAGLVALRRRR